MITDITEHGAVGDGQTLNTRAIQAAIDHAVQQRGDEGEPAALRIPEGTYRTGTLYLRSNLTVELRGTLLGSENLDHYPTDTDPSGDRTGRHLIVARGCENLTLTGAGIIDGSGPAFWTPPEPNRHPLHWRTTDNAKRPSPMVDLSDCTNLTLEGFKLTNSPGWTLHLNRCTDVRIDRVSIENDPHGPNTDGIDLNGGQNVVIENCHIVTGDDGIVLKTTADSRPCRAVTIRDCYVQSLCAAIKLGTESYHDFTDITVQRCECPQSNRLFAVYLFDGGNAERVTVQQVTGDTHVPLLNNRPIHFDLRRRRNREGEPVHDQPVGHLREVRITDFLAETDGRILMTAVDGARIEDVVMKNITMRCPVRDDPAMLADLYIGSQASAQSPRARAARALIVLEGVHGLRVDGLAVVTPAELADEAGQPPEAWVFEEKAANGTMEIFNRNAFRDRLDAPFAYLWERDCTGIVGPG